MKAHARSIRIAPKKAAIVAQMVRGMTVVDALGALRRTHKKAARIIELLIASAAANAEHNDKQDRNILVIRTIMVNQGAAYNRGVPMARGRMRPMKKFMSHISVTLGVADDSDEKTQKTQKTQRTPMKAKKTSSTASQSAKNAVKTSKQEGSLESSASLESSSSSPK